MKGRQDEDGRLTKTRLGLAEDVNVQDSGRNADLLDCNKAERHVRLVFDALRLEKTKREEEEKRKFASQCPSILSE